MWQRILSGSICMVSVAWFTSSYQRSPEFPFEALLAVLGAAGAWIWAEQRHDKPAPSAVPALHPNDVALGLRLREVFSPALRRFLREHSFGQPFRNGQIAGIETIADDWQGAAYEFEDEELDNISAEIVRLSSEFANKIGLYSGPAMRWGADFLSIPTDHERADDLFTEQTFSNIREIDDIANQIVGKVDEFEKAFRRLSPESFSPDNVLPSA